MTAVGARVRLIVILIVAVALPCRADFGSADGFRYAVE
jgi:hypothetical protein